VSSFQFPQSNQIASSAHLLEFVKEHNANLNFPQKLMLMLSYVDNERDNGNFITCISWVRDGHAFVIKDRKELVDNLLPLFFREGKFPSFTRKLYRWGFRQICIPKGGNKKDRDLLFGHEHFQRDNKGLMAEMRSVTAAGTRRAIAALTNKKKARKHKEKQEKSNKAPILIPSPAACVPAVENASEDRVNRFSGVKPQSLVQVHLERLLGGPSTATKSVNTTAQTPFPAPHSLGQNPTTQSALDSLLNARSSPIRDIIKQGDLVQMHLERLLGGSNTATKPASTTIQPSFQNPPSLVQNPTTQSVLDSLLKARSSPTRDVQQGDLVQMHLERLLGGSNTATKPASTTVQTALQNPDIGQSSTAQSAVFSLSRARSSPTENIKQGDLGQMHLERLLGGSHNGTKPPGTKTQTPFQTPGLGQNSTQTTYDALLKAKSHSLMPAPVQNKSLSLGDSATLQNHVKYLKAMSQSPMATPASSSLMLPSLSFDVGARIQALQSQSSSQARADPRNSGMSCLPKSYLDLIQGSGGLAGPPAASASFTNQVSNLILLQ